ncbi:hypothetical protein XAC2852_260077 [Xanthomonas citri pv. citri]|nr:hypothetical protein XAC9322_230078 [Xanthomonas citri pv. citri]CEE36703.1 hypothetical protein XAC908_340231 [Xanthomonas citri pv. citri]CEE63478.1 hypothetical protein XAC2852_260077 [Xanthomonas citri pv. citri]CEE73009.1 hypothetical protein XACLC80_220078 [Xanthomonas citri pv. citri]CEE83436.1 hypothetical protein XAC3218_360066 [Xanthomonas citri pv. citri]
MPQPGRQRVAHQQRNAQTQQHAPHCSGTLIGWADRCGHQRRNAEVGAMRQPGDEATQQHGVVARRQCAGHVAQRIEHHQQQQQGAPRPARAQDRQQGRTHHHTQCIRADDVTDLRLGNLQALRNLRHQAHGGKFADADRKAAHRQRKQDQHVIAPGHAWRRKIGIGHARLQECGGGLLLCNAAEHESATPRPGWAPAPNPSQLRRFQRDRDAVSYLYRSNLLESTTIATKHRDRRGVAPGA